jgi:biopolymer transport protein ExbD
LHRYREACTANRSPAPVTIAPSDTTPHRAVIKVMDACAEAGIDAVNFALGEA